ncbi:MAG: SMC-Scp complex subunit ScpB [Myxococcales bacterium]|nr:SMC-Scp complex subunit ScpB [Myxococcales bacterium]
MEAPGEDDLGFPSAAARAAEDAETARAFGGDVDGGDGDLELPGQGLGEEDDGEGAVAATLPTSASKLNDVQLAGLLEALIFASDKPLTLVRLRQLTRVSDSARLGRVLDQLAAQYQGRGISLGAVSGGYQFRTESAYSAWVQQLIAGRPVRLSRAQLETLAIIAYRQPITRPEIDEIRGVDSSGTLKMLMDRNLVRILGKREEVGRPMLYGTTKEFLDFFSLGDLRELPTLREYSELSPESRAVVSKMGFDAPGGQGSPPADAAPDGVQAEESSDPGLGAEPSGSQMAPDPDEEIDGGPGGPGGPGGGPGEVVDEVVDEVIDEDIDEGPSEDAGPRPRGSGRCRGWG